MFKNLSRSLFIILISFSINAAEYGGVNPDMGKPGEPTRVPKDNEFKVCADQNNLPYSNDKSEGFENKIAEVIAKDLGKELSYQFWPDRFGFLRNTLNAKRCDVVIGTNTTYDALNTTKPYYRAGHVWVYRKDSGYDIKNWDSPDLKKGIIGLADKSPVTQALSRNGLMANAKPYRIQRDLTKSPGEPVEDVASGKIDVAIMWGPLGGYYAKQSEVELVVVPIPEYSEGNTRLQGKTYWNISAGVRRGEDDRRQMVEEAIFRNLDKIYAIMDEYGIPHTEPIFVDRLDGYKRHKK
jgi:mxaJ protein